MKPNSKKLVPIIFAAFAVVILVIAAIVAISKPKLGDAVTISFSVNGGSGSITSQSKHVGQYVDEPTTDPTRTNYTFLGWFEDSTCLDEWDFDSDLIEASMTLYAGWELVPYFTINASSYTGITQSISLTDVTSTATTSSLPSSVATAAANAKGIYEISGTIGQATATVISTNGFATGAYAICLSVTPTGYGDPTNVKVNDTTVTPVSNRVLVEIPSKAYGFTLTYTFSETTVTYVFYTADTITLTPVAEATVGTYTGVNQTITVTSGTYSEVKAGTSLKTAASSSVNYRIDGSVSKISTDAATTKGFTTDDYVVMVHIDLYQYSYTTVKLYDDSGVSTDITTNYNGDIFAKLTAAGDGFWVEFSDASNNVVVKVLFYTIEAPFVFE